MTAPIGRLSHVCVSSRAALTGARAITIALRQSRSGLRVDRRCWSCSRAKQIDAAAETAARRPMRNRGRRPARPSALAGQKSVASRTSGWRPFHRRSLLVLSGMWSTDGAQIVAEGRRDVSGLTSPLSGIQVRGSVRIAHEGRPGLPGWTFQKWTCPSRMEFRSPSCWYSWRFSHRL